MPAPAEGRLAWVVLLGLMVLTPLVFCTHTTDVFEENKVALLGAGAILLAALAISAGLASLGNWPARWPHYLQRAWDDLRRDPLLLGACLFALSAVVSTTCSLNPRTSWRGEAQSFAGLQTLLAYLAVFLAARALGRPPAARRLLFAVVPVTAVVVAYALVQWLGLDPLSWEGLSVFAGHRRPFSTLGHPNFLGAYLALALPLIAFFALRAFADRGYLAGILLVGLGLTSVGVLVLTFSRAAWLAAGCAWAVLVVGWFLAGRRRAAAVLVGLGAVVGAAFLVVAFTHTLDDRLGISLRERLIHLDSGAGRWEMWQAAWALFRERPWVGWGPDAFRLAFGLERPAAYVLVEWDAAPTRAHNVLLHTLVTQGALGGVALALLVFGLVKAAVRAWPADRPLTATVFAAVVGFVVQSAFGYTVAGCGVLFFTLAGFLSAWAPRKSEGGRRKEEEEQPSSSSFLLLTSSFRRVVAGALALILVNLFVVTPFRARLAQGEGERLLPDRPADAHEALERSLELDPDWAPAWVQLSAAGQYEARQAADPVRKKGHYDRARLALERAIALVPVSPHLHASLGRLLGEMATQGLASPSQALAEWETALAGDPRNPTFLAEAARTALAVNRPQRARAYARRGESLYPGTGLFSSLLGAAALRDGRLDEARHLLERSLHEDWRGDPEELGRAHALLATTHLRRGEFVLASQAAWRARDRRPDWPLAQYLLAQAAQALGDRAGAVREYRRLLELAPGHPAAVQALRQLADAE
jgi:O-antigen ligase/tetratricopeptide (TPR) repeat protein